MNIDKSKMLVFSRGRRRENLQLLKYDDGFIEVVIYLNYLGVIEWLHLKFCN